MITITRSGPSLVEQMHAHVLERTRSDIADVDPEGTLKIALEGGTLEFGPASAPTYWAVTGSAGERLDGGAGIPPAGVVSKWGGFKASP